MLEQRVARRQLASALVPLEHESPADAAGKKEYPVLVRALLVLSDVALGVLLWELAQLLQGSWGQGPLSEATVTLILPCLVVWICVRALTGLYPGYGLDQVESLQKHVYTVLATVATTAVFAAALQIGDAVSRLLLAAWFLGLLTITPLVRHAVKSLMRRIGLWGKPVVVFSSGESGARVTRLLRSRWELGYEPVAVFDYRLVHSDDPYRRSIEEVFPEVTGMADRNVDTAIFAMPHTRREQVSTLVGWASASFRHVLVIPNLGGITNSAVVARNLAGTFAVEIRYNLLNPWALRAKRATDLCATVVGGIFILPFILFLALLVYLESGGGPVLYRDRRMGQDGKLFSCLKFRTMVPGAEELLWRLLKENPELREEYSRHHKLRDDPRVTRVGRFLRRTSLDELPQLWNVLKGEMSLVGPRPYLPRESEEIGRSQGEILRVPPGITGPWQVSGRSHTSFLERVDMDAYYVRDWSIWLDLVLLVRTARSVLLGRGAY